MTYPKHRKETNKLTTLHDLLKEVDNLKDEIVELLQELVRIPTVNTGIMPTGNETALCEFLKKKLDAEGIESEILESIPTRGNLVAHLPGENNGRARLMFMSHTDVVPIGDESKWRHPPFSGKLDGGRIYGRGSDDCKGLTASQTMATILLKRLNIPLKRSLILAAGCDEETGSKYGFRWLASNKREKIDAELAINEGGGSSFNTPKGICYAVALGEKGRLEANIHFTGKSCHASVPWKGDNTLIKLSQAIQRISQYKPELNVSVNAFQELPRLFHVSPSEITPENIDNIIGKISHEDSVINSMLRGLSRMTVTPTMATGGIKSNVIPDSYNLICDIRVLPGQDIPYVTKELESILRDIEGCKVEIRGTTSPSASKPDDVFLQSIKCALGEVLEKNVEIMQTLTVGFTDSSAVRPLGTLVYNFAPGHPDSEPGLSNVHGDNESISVEDMVFQTKVMAAIAYDMLT
ncbi:M20/M25/M40 family metallo-hydrolase [Candidatus Poribacteria bacterium]|nr:M20/M25/M40 family metallo-hydrolase [Candidatus Poribacteria bacterium]